MSDPQNAIPRHLQGGVPDPVPFESRPGAVELVPVELDDQPAIVPDDVHLETGNEGIDRRRRQPLRAGELEE